MAMSLELIGAIVVAISFLVSSIMFPIALRYAKKHNIVDNPNARKLQRVPVPVLGGAPVYIGILAAMIFGLVVMKTPIMWVTVGAMTVMLIIGTWDDIKDLPAIPRFLVEVLLVWVVMAINGMYADSLHGLWRIESLNEYIALPISLVAGVGIINAVNLIDGVDGYSSSYGILTNALFSIVFFVVGEYSFGLLALAASAALIPFFFHNVFGKKSKMFFGDGGTLMLGVLMTSFVFALLSSKTNCASLENYGISLVALAIAFLAIPVFDTLRVMSARIVRGKSPFHPDKTHLHHLFIDMGFSHIGASLSILLMQLIVILSWFLSWRLGASIDAQFYVVVFLGALVTFGFYRFMRIQQQGGPVDDDGIPVGSKLWQVITSIGRKTHWSNGKNWSFWARLMDSHFLSGEK